MDWVSTQSVHNQPHPHHMTNYHTPDPQAWAEIQNRAWRLVDAAEVLGIVLEIRTQPVAPLAMGNSMMTVEMRPARIPQPPKLTIEEMAKEAMRRVQCHIAFTHSFDSHDVSVAFDQAFFDFEIRTRRAARQSMLLQGRTWFIGPRFNLRWKAKR